MSDCCCSNASAKSKQVCPECGSAGISVGIRTLYHQVRFPENQAIAAVIDHLPLCKRGIEGDLSNQISPKPSFTKRGTERLLTADSYFYCPSKHCAVGYFSSHGIAVPKQSLRSYSAIQQEKLCYCFDIDAGQYSAALKANRAQPIKDFVIQRTKSGECACEIRNPSGQCCLANFKYLEKSQSQ